MSNLVVHCRKQKFDILIDRRTIWGNPFIIGIDGTREDVIAKHKDWFYNSTEAAHLRSKVHELKGKILGCWCAPLSCHGDTLANASIEGLSVDNATPVN